MSDDAPEAIYRDASEATERLASLLVNVARTVGARVAIADEAARTGDAEERDRVNEATAKMLIKTIDALSSRLSAPGNAPIASALYVARRMFDDFVARTPHLPPHMVARSRLD